MKSKILVFVALIAVGLLYAKNSNACLDDLMFETGGVCACAVELYGGKIQQVGDECVPIEGYEWFGGSKYAACEGNDDSSPCFPVVVPIDTDDDGFADVDDDCDEKSAPDSENGCPEGACPDGERCMTTGGTDSTDKDTDGDGVKDDVDKCKDTKEGVKVDKTGCELDTDKDGVPDSSDKCPTVAAKTKDGCVAADISSDYDDGGGCTLIPNAQTMNLATLIMFLIPIAQFAVLRRKK